MRSTTGCRSVLVVAGGFPGEWEGEHPYDTVRRLGATGVFFVGWQDHDDLAEHAQLQRRLRCAVGRGTVRTRLPRGDGERASADRHQHRRAAVVHQRRPCTSDRMAGATRRRRRDGRALAEAVSNHAERRERGSECGSVRPRALLVGRRRPQRSPALYDEVDRAIGDSTVESSSRIDRRSASRRTGWCSSRRRAGGARSAGRRAPRPTSGCASPTRPVVRRVDRERHLALHRQARRRRAARGRRASPGPDASPTSATPPHRR